MKFCGSIILIFAVTLASTSPLNQDKNEDRQIITDCAKEFNIPLGEFIAELGYSYKLPYDNTTGHNFVKCAVEKLGLFDKDSGFKIESIENKFQSSKDVNLNSERLVMALKCAKSVNEATYTNDCERAYNGIKCFFNEMKDEYFKENPEAKYEMECREELKIPASEMEHYNTYGRSYKANSNNPIFHCFIKCFYEKIGILEKNNISNLEHFYSIAGGAENDPSGEYLAKIKKCTSHTTNQVSKNVCERVFREIECIRDIGSNAGKKVQV